MSVWHRRILFVFFLVGVVLIGRHTPSGSGQMQVTEFSDVGEPAPQAVADVVEPRAPAPVAAPKDTKLQIAKVEAEPRRKVAAIKTDEQPVAPSNYKRVSIDMTDYIPPETKQSRVTASVEKQLVSNKSRFALADALAVETDKFNSSMGEEIEEKAGFTIYKPADKSAAPGFALEERTRPVVVNQASGAIGVVTGTIVVRLKDFEEADALANAFGLELVSSDDSIATVFYKAPKGREIDDLIELLRADGRVTRADAEIIQSTRQIH